MLRKMSGSELLVVCSRDGQEGVKEVIFWPKKKSKHGGNSRDAAASERRNRLSLSSTFFSREKETSEINDEMEFQGLI